MQRRYRRGDEICEIEVGEETITIRDGSETKTVDTYATMGVPPRYAYPALVPPSYVEELPDDLLAMIEAAQEVTLTGRIRAFYADGEWKRYQRMHCNKLDCRVDFIADDVLFPFTREYAPPLIAISAKLVGPKDAPDEQQWIGIDPSKPDGPIYELFTSNAYEPAYASLDAFLSDLTAPAGSPGKP